jgi:hypothetical protein
MLDTVKEAFDQIALPVQLPIVATAGFAMRAWRNTRFGSAGANACTITNVRPNSV